MLTNICIFFKFYQEPEGNTMAVCVYLYLISATLQAICGHELARFIFSNLDCMKNPRIYCNTEKKYGLYMYILCPAPPISHYYCDLPETSKYRPQSFRPPLTVIKTTLEYTIQPPAHIKYHKQSHRRILIKPRSGVKLNK